MTDFVWSVLTSILLAATIYVSRWRPDPKRAAVKRLAKFNSGLAVRIPILWED